jgi:lipopolysaccharide heptosyltransferase II
MPCATWADARNLLCIRLDSLGDVAMTEPALRAVKRAAPGRRVTLLTSPSGMHLTPLLSGVDAAVAYEAPWMKATPPRTSARLDRAFAERLRRLKFDGAIVFTVFSQSPLPAAHLCYLADIPLRLAHSRENPYQLLTDWAHEYEPEQLVRHEVQRQLDLVAAIGATVDDDRISLNYSQADDEAALRALARAGVDAQAPWIAIHPGASAASRRWPPEHFAAAADELVRRTGIQAVFTGRPDERSLVASIRAAMSERCCSLVGRLTVPQLAAALARAAILISNNSGPVHVAAGVGLPVVDLYALTNPQHTPWRVAARVLSHDVSCKYCYRSACPQLHHACLRQVSPAQAVDAAMELLAAAARTSPSRLAS